MRANPKFGLKRAKIRFMIVPIIFYHISQISWPVSFAVKII